MATGAAGFPELTPTSRSFTPGDYPSGTFESLSGAKTFLRYGSKRVNATMTLQFLNLTDDDADWILDHYRIVNEDWDSADEKTRWVTFSTTRGLGGAEANMPSYMMPTGLRWRYQQAPTVTSVFKGRSNVSCSFVSCLDAA